ncbi:MAG: response regulator [Luteibaculum sp.]
MAYHGIAIIDDDNLFRHIMKAQIDRLKASKFVLMFENGEEAINYFKSHIQNPEEFVIPKIIFLDINMPVMNGWQFLEAFAPLREQIEEEITIYIVTSSANEKDREKAAEFTEVTKYVVKPITSAQLGTILSNSTELD